MIKSFNSDTNNYINKLYIPYITFIYGGMKMEISFTRRVSKMGNDLMIKIPEDMKEHFKHKTLCKIIKMPEAGEGFVSADKLIEKKEGE